MHLFGEFPVTERVKPNKLQKKRTATYKHVTTAWKEGAVDQYLIKDNRLDFVFVLANSYIQQRTRKIATNYFNVVNVDIAVRL